MYEQFLALLQSMEDGDNKTNLITAFTKLQEDNKSTIEARDKAKAENAPLKELLNGIKSASGLDELNADSLKTLLDSKSRGGAEVEALNTTVKELREKYTGLEATHNDFVSSAEAKSFELALSQSDIFKNVSPDPFLRNAVMGTVKDKLVVGEDGKLYAKGVDGKPMNDIVSGKPILGTSLFESMVTSGAISKSALVGTVGSGTGGEGGGKTPIVGSETMSATEKMKQARV